MALTPLWFVFRPATPLIISNCPGGRADSVALLLWVAFDAMPPAPVDDVVFVTFEASPVGLPAPEVAPVAVSVMLLVRPDILF